MYIQYFCTKLFSGTGVIGSPSGVSGGGTRSSGLEIESDKFKNTRGSIYRGGNRGDFSTTLALCAGKLPALVSGHAPS
jgi:hypothetical protein